MEPLKQNGKHSLCATTKVTPQKQDVIQLCQNWRAHYEKHIRASQNEWLLEDMAWYVDELNKVLYQQFKHGIICKEAYQDCMAIAWEQWAGLALDVKQFEKQEDYIIRLCGCNDGED